MLEIREIAYIKSGITHVLKLPFTLKYENLDRNATLTKEQAETVLVDFMDYLRENCEIRHKVVRKRKPKTARKARRKK